MKLTEHEKALASAPKIDWKAVQEQIQGMTLAQAISATGIPERELIRKRDLGLIHWKKSERRRSHGDIDPLYNDVKAFVVRTEMTKVLDIVDKFSISTVRATEMLRALEDEGVLVKARSKRIVRK